MLNIRSKYIAVLTDDTASSYILLAFSFTLSFGLIIISPTKNVVSQMHSLRSLGKILLTSCGLDSEWTNVYVILKLKKKAFTEFQWQKQI